MGANELSAQLWRQRELLDLLIFKLDTERLHLLAGNSRWLPHATAEVNRAVEMLTQNNLAVATLVNAVAEEWAVASPEPSLQDLMNAAPPGPWGELFRAHLEAMRSQTNQIQTLRDANEGYLRAAARSTQETLAELRPAAGTYDFRGATGPGPDTSSLLDTKL